MSANLDDGIAPSCAAEKDAPAVESRWSFAAKKRNIYGKRRIHVSAYQKRASHDCFHDQPCSALVKFHDINISRKLCSQCCDFIFELLCVPPACDCLSNSCCLLYSLRQEIIKLHSPVVEHRSLAWNPPRFQHIESDVLVRHIHL